MCIVFGFNERLSVTPEVDPIQCPRCHNHGCVHKAKSREWFELFWVPLIPMSGRAEIGLCQICGWKAMRPKDMSQNRQKTAAEKPPPLPT